MSCASALYTVNQSGQTVPATGTIPFGDIIRRYGLYTDLNGSGIVIGGRGYYKVSLSATLTAQAAGLVTVTLQADGSDVVGMTASETATAAEGVVNLKIDGIVRQTYYEQPITLTAKVTGVPVLVNNVATTVIKI